MQKVVALSSCEAEYIAAATAACQAVWLARLLAEILDSVVSKPVLRVDNKSTISLIKNPVHHDRSKHIDTRFHLIWEYAHNGQIEVRFIRTDEQLGDVLTKPLCKIKFQELCTKIGLRLFRRMAIVGLCANGALTCAVFAWEHSEKEGRAVSQIEAWVYTHRGKNPQDPTSLNIEDAAACLEKYKTKAIELNGPDFDWLHSPVDARAIYQCCFGRPHGKWATFNGMVDDGEVLAVANSHCESSRVFNHQHREEEHEREGCPKMRALQRKMGWIFTAKEYAQTLLEWGRGVQNQYNSMQSFMQNVAQHTGMSASAVPSPLSLPPPPTCGVSALQILLLKMLSISALGSCHHVFSSLCICYEECIFFFSAIVIFGTGYIALEGQLL
ncbi:uncharacterized protein LOC133930127 [Phragmites australis]|uniref:uncharacterized protein LOC133930127 n=1 Tax=Phragmites australis TaxID=29695 RepID=UPI002D76C9E3|nr:uncharacterized protein LOC133930127 [Phragmites australis]